MAFPPAPSVRTLGGPSSGGARPLNTLNNSSVGTSRSQSSDFWSMPSRVIGAGLGLWSVAAGASTNNFASTPSITSSLKLQFFSCSIICILSTSMSSALAGVSGRISATFVTNSSIDRPTRWLTPARPIGTTSSGPAESLSLSRLPNKLSWICSRRSSICCSSTPRFTMEALKLLWPFIFPHSALVIKPSCETSTVAKACLMSLSSSLIAVDSFSCLALSVMTSHKTPMSMFKSVKAVMMKKTMKTQNKNILPPPRSHKSTRAFQFSRLAVSLSPFRIVMSTTLSSHLAPTSLMASSVSARLSPSTPRVKSVIMESPIVPKSSMAVGVSSR
mmetsp:Transcript_74014/g.128452  ORF Transcript_74014/g.128452 Transcript_74014/m.128452 type:complete len:331 (+) Transcript_74014:113-1105(+)